MANPAFNCGVYTITHADSARRYVGSSIDLAKRLRDHKNLLQQDRHPNRHLQRAWNKYTAEKFRFEILLICSHEDKLFYEQKAMDEFQAANPKFGFNQRPRAADTTGVPSWNKGIPCSEETKRKLRATHLGRPSGNKGKFMTKESKDKLSLSLKEKFKDPAHKEKMAALKIGKKYGPYKAGNVLKTHCPKGHPYSGDNLYIHPSANRRGCKACIRISSENRRLR